MPQQPTTTGPLWGEQRLAELRRELQMKHNAHQAFAHYPGWVRDGKLTQRTADHREQVIRDVLADLEKLYQVPPQPAQGQLFAGPLRGRAVARSQAPAQPRPLRRPLARSRP